MSFALPTSIKYSVNVTHCRQHKSGAACHETNEATRERLIHPRLTCCEEQVLWRSVRFPPPAAVAVQPTPSPPLPAAPATAQFLVSAGDESPWSLAEKGRSPRRASPVSLKRRYCDNKAWVYRLNGIWKYLAAVGGMSVCAIRVYSLLFACNTIDSVPCRSEGTIIGLYLELS